MGLFDKLKTTSAADRLIEEKLYEQVAQELKAGKKREGIWVKAMAKSGGELNKAEALYIDLRVQAIRDEKTIFTSKESKITSDYESVDKCIQILKDKGYAVKMNDHKNFTIYVKPIIMGSVRGKASSVKELCKLANEYQKLSY